MNFFAVIEGELHTPLLSGTILPGITRDSVITLARDSGLSVHERNIDVDELLADIRSGRCSEAFACGTATIVAPINAIGDRGDVFELNASAGPVAQQLRDALLDIQEGRAPDRFEWLYRIPPECYPEQSVRRSA
jgi:branched-chain amino acid aminotransferase